MTNETERDCVMEGCPHKEMHECPRYVASHGAGGEWGCIDDHPTKPCAVRRGKIKYEDQPNDQ